MNKYERKRDELLHQYGFVLRRDRRHLNFSKEDGTSPFVISKTPSSQSASVRQLADLNRIIRGISRNSDEPATQAVAPANSEAHPIKRFAPRNNSPRSTGQVLIPKLDPVPRSGGEDGLSGPVPADSIVSVLMAADQSAEFWKLDACGRIRALVGTVSRRSSNFKIDVLPAQFIRASIDEIGRHFGVGEGPGATHDIEAIFEREGSLYLRTMGEWGYTGVPSLAVNDPWIGPALIEASAWSALENTDHLFLRYGEEWKGTSYGIASLVWNSQDPRRPPADGAIPDHCIYWTFVTKGMMKRKRFTLQTCGAWVNPNLTRKAVREIQDIMSQTALQTPPS